MTIDETQPRSDKNIGFTLIELLVVLAITATLLSIVAPRYFTSVDNAKEAALKANLRILRESLDNYKSDTGQYPTDLNQLIERHYIRTIPMDPITEKVNSWVLIPHPDKVTRGIYDITSGAPGKSSRGTLYREW